MTTHLNPEISPESSDLSTSPFRRVVAAVAELSPTLAETDLESSLEQRSVATTPYAGRLVVSGPGLGQEIYL